MTPEFTQEAWWQVDVHWLVVSSNMAPARICRTGCPFSCSKPALRCREDLTGWQDEASCSSDDETPQARLSSALSGQVAQVLQAENALSLKPLLASAERRNSGQLPPLFPSMGRQGSESEFLPKLPGGFCPPCPGSPTEPPLPPSTRSSVDGRSSMSSYRSVQAGSVFSRASSDCQSTDWETALSSTTGYTVLNSRSSLDGCSSRRGSTDGRPSLDGRPPLPGLHMKRADTADSSIMSAVPESSQTGLLEGQCPGCGSLSECCCKVGPRSAHATSSFVGRLFCMACCRG